MKGKIRKWMIIYLIKTRDMKIYRVYFDGVSGFSNDPESITLYVHNKWCEDRIVELFAKQGFKVEEHHADPYQYHRLEFNGDLVDELIDNLKGCCTHPNSSYPLQNGDIVCLDCQEVLFNIQHEAI